MASQKPPREYIVISQRFAAEAAFPLETASFAHSCFTIRLARSMCRFRGQHGPGVAYRQRPAWPGRADETMPVVTGEE